MLQPARRPGARTESAPCDKLGVPAEQSKALVASGAGQATSRTALVGNVPVVQIDEGFDRAWRRVGLSLDRTGFTVEDRDRSQGTYFVRYVEPNADRQEKGFLGKLFSGPTKATPPIKYRISLKSQGESTPFGAGRQRGAGGFGQRAAHRPGHRGRPALTALPAGRSAGCRISGPLHP